MYQQSEVWTHKVIIFKNIYVCLVCLGFCILFFFKTRNHQARPKFAALRLQSTVQLIAKINHLMEEGDREQHFSILQNSSLCSSDQSVSWVLKLLLKAFLYDLCWKGQRRVLSCLRQAASVAARLAGSQALQRTAILGCQPTRKINGLIIWRRGSSFRLIVRKARFKTRFVLKQ